jgi:Fe-S-cluster containining protein
MSSEHDALVAKVEAFTAAAFERARDQMACRRGCDGCCFAWLTVDQVEADRIRAALAELPADLREEVRTRGSLQQEREAARASEPRCAMLQDDGSCAVYIARPLVCRTQGYALRYPEGFIPAAAVRMRVNTGEVTHCPLNFTQREPALAEVIDAERVDQILAVVNQRHSLARGLDPMQRHSLSALAAEAADSKDE